MLPHNFTYVKKCGKLKQNSKDAGFALMQTVQQHDIFIFLGKNVNVQKTPSNFN